MSTSLEYFHLRRGEQTQEVARMHPGDADWAISAWFLEQAVPSMITTEYVNGPFPICHADMHYNNILVDEDFNITGILDWSDLHTGPVELFAANPEFQTFPGRSDEDNAPIVAFRVSVADEVRRLSHECNDALGLMLADLVGSPRSELVYRCIWTFPWRTQVDARSALKLLYGKNASWADFKRMRLESACFRSESQ